MIFFFFTGYNQVIEFDKILFKMKATTTVVHFIFLPLRGIQRAYNLLDGADTLYQSLGCVGQCVWCTFFNPTVTLICQDSVKEMDYLHNQVLVRLWGKK